MFSDFFERSWQNFLQGFLVGILDIVILMSASMYLALDTNTLHAGDGYLAVFKVIAIIISILYFVMRNYIYLMIVTFKIRFAPIIKNAALFLVLNFVRNLFTILGVGIVLFLTTGVTVFCMAIYTFALARFIEVFNALPAINKYMLEPMRRKEGKQLAEPIFQDDVTKKEQEK